MRLTDFQHALSSGGYAVEFEDGILYHEEAVAFRKITDREIVMEGTVGPKYFAIKELLYKEFSIV